MFREFCSEIILSFLEFVQFRNYNKNEICKMNGNNISTETDPFDFKLYDGMPKSTIVYETWNGANASNSRCDVANLSAVVHSGSHQTEDPLRRIKMIAHLFLEKYIGHGVKLEINISGWLRNRYIEMDQKQYDGMKLEEFVTFYNEVTDKIMIYQSQSFLRFALVNRVPPRNVMTCLNLCRI